MPQRPITMPKQLFEKDEKALCFHGELLYEAKILEVSQESSSDPFQYRIHYKGWKASWDDWVEDDRLRKITDENRETAQALRRQYHESTQKPTKTTATKRKGQLSDFGSARGSEERNASAPVTGRGQKRGRNAEIEDVSDCSCLMVYQSLRPDRNNIGLLAAPGMPPPSPQHVPSGCYTFLGTGLYSPTESLKEFMDEGSAAYSAWTEPKPAPDTSANVSWQAKKPKKSKLPPRKKQRVAILEEEEFDDSYEARVDEIERTREDLERWAEKARKKAIGNTKELPDFPHPVNRQDKQYPAPETPKKFVTAGIPLDPLLIELRFGQGYKRAKKPSAGRKRRTAKSEEDKEAESTDPPKRAKREETFHHRPTIKIPIPDYIKSLLVDDWEEVTKNLALVPLPAPKSANMIIDEYFEEEKTKRSEGSAEMDLLEEVRSGLKEYFDVALGRTLLYRLERQQYLDARKAWTEGKGEWKGKTCVGDVYGAEHLCRMIVQLPEMIAHTNMDGQSVNRLREELTKFLVWLSKNTGTYFTADYEKASPEYLEKSRGI
ncbi:MAG: hypothetical protein L6R40_003669 [Gallowayella cf. fulva]|nr:MAG: hypothetical protein L6R40_003669 [Xanthomendoza cf. fulva]